jgi:hypothetical protein
LLRFDRWLREPSERSAYLVVQCRVCNFEPNLDQAVPKVCPKCHASVWEQFARRDHVEPSERAGHRAVFRVPRSRGFA